MLSGAGSCHNLATPKSSPIDLSQDSCAQIQARYCEVEIFTRNLIELNSLLNLIDENLFLLKILNWLKYKSGFHIC